ncbi:hypothetical protein ACFVW1_21065 [Streptomyces olivochromogenes]|uniref:hypothetical protein n=1 Tax=Streptomyces olivochromogenes TaxID=1963 RepID=UPI0036DB6A78
MPTTLRSAVAAAVLAAALVAPVAVATDAAAATCARHTTGVCKDSTWSLSAHARGISSHHRGVKYWYR